MAKKIKVELDPKGMEELLNGPEMRNYLNKLANKKRNQLGKGYSAYVLSTKGHAKHPRQVLFMRTKSKKSERDNLENNTLLKALNND